MLESRTLDEIGRNIYFYLIRLFVSGYYYSQFDFFGLINISLIFGILTLFRNKVIYRQKEVPRSFDKNMVLV